MTVLSVDPGDTTGMVLWTEQGEVIGIPRKLSHEEFLEWLAYVDIPLSTVVVEDYTSRKNQTLNKKGSKLKAAKGVGAVELLAAQKGAVLVKQKPDILRLAALHAAVKIPKGHIPDDVSAYLHGWYYFESIGVLKPVKTEKRLLL